MGGEIGCQNAPEIRLGCSVGRTVVVGQVEMGDAEIEGSAADLALGAPRSIIAEVVPQPERDGG